MATGHEKQNKHYKGALRYAHSTQNSAQHSLLSIIAQLVTPTHTVFTSVQSKHFLPHRIVIWLVILCGQVTSVTF